MAEFLVQPPREFQTGAVVTRDDGATDIIVFIKKRRMSSCMASVEMMSAAGVTAAQVRNMRRG